MKKDRKSTGKSPDPYPALVDMVREAPALVLGTVIKLPPSSATANPCYIWTRKINGKTETQALSKAQYVAFKKAIARNREVEKQLKLIREISTRGLLASIDGVKKRKPYKKREKSPSKSS